MTILILGWTIASALAGRVNHSSCHPLSVTQTDLFSLSGLLCEEQHVGARRRFHHITRNQSNLWRGEKNKALTGKKTTFRYTARDLICLTYFSDYLQEFIWDEMFYFTWLKPTHLHLVEDIFPKFFFSFCLYNIYSNKGV